MTNRVQEHKIIAMQAIIFVSLLFVLSFLLEGCAIKNDNVDQVNIENQSVISCDDNGRLDPGPVS